MKNKRFLLILIVVMIVAVAIVLFSLRSDSVDTVIKVSEDGRFTLEIPDGALPKGVNSEEIKITVLSDEEGMASGEPIYKLEPDGLKLSVPARVVLSGKDFSEDFSVFGLFHVSGEGTNARVDLLDADLEVNEKEKTYTLTSEIEHFSMIYEIRGNHFFEVTENNEQTIHKIDDTFNVSFTIKPIKEKIERHNSKFFEHDVYLLPGSTWKYYGGLESWPDHIIDPTEIKKEPSEDLNLDASYMLSDNFTCMEEGFEPITSVNHGGAKVTLGVDTYKCWYEFKDNEQIKKCDLVEHYEDKGKLWINLIQRHKCQDGGFILMHQCHVCKDVPRGGLCSPHMVSSKEQCDELGGKFTETKLK